MKNKLLKIGFLVASFSSVQVALAIENKVALVIGNANYKDAKLKNSVNDARDMRDALKKVGFDVVYVENATNEQMGAVRDEFLDKLNKDSVALFYYAGHGVQSDGSNYLIPIDAKIKTKSDLQYQSKDVGFFLGAMEDAGNETNIVILDACRNNPFRGVRAISGGLTSPTNTPTGSIIAYATAPGKVTDDNRSGNNGLYTSYLKQYLFEPGLTIEAALKKVSKSVKKDNPEQVPWYNTSMDEDLCLAGCDGSAVITQPTGTPPTISLISGADLVVKNKTYTIKFKATDADGDLSKIDVQWGDGTANTSKAASNGATISFTHTYKFSGIQPLVASAIDKLNATSEFSKSVTVQEPVSVVKIPTVSNANASPSSIIYGNSITFNTKLNANLPTGYSVQIDYGNGLMQMNGSGASFSLSAKPTDLGSSLFTVGIYDNNGNLKSNQLTGNYSVSEPAPVVIETPKPVETKPTTTKGEVETFVSGDRTFSYTKIANNGSELPKTAKLGTKPTDWACTKDNNTGLIWEVKTTDGGLRDMKNLYTNYTEDYPKCDWTDCEKDWKGKLGDSNNTDVFVKAVNKQSLCGNSDWRLPENEELKGLVVCSDNKYTNLGKDEYGYICTGSPTAPTINKTYFPNTQADWFWSSSPYADYSYVAWVVVFSNGYSGNDLKYNNNNVRLVRG